MQNEIKLDVGNGYHSIFLQFAKNTNSEYSEVGYLLSQIKRLEMQLLGDSLSETEILELEQWCPAAENILQRIQKLIDFMDNSFVN